MDNPLYDYSAITSRPALDLPDGARVAVWVGVNVEHYAWGRPAISLAPHTAQLTPDPLNYAWRDYGPRAGVWRLMSMLDRAGVPVSAIINSQVCEDQPEIVEAGNRHGWTWVAHGQSNSAWQVGMAPAAEREAIAAVAEVIERETGTRPRGWLGPGVTTSPATADLLAELGFTYSLDWAADDQPFDLKVASGRLISVPRSTELNDLAAFAIAHQTADAFAAAVEEAVDVLLEEEGGRVLGIGLHPFLTGQPFRARVVVRALERIARRDGVWLTTSDQIADRFIATS